MRFFLFPSLNSIDLAEVTSNFLVIALKGLQRACKYTPLKLLTQAFTVTPI
jgi:hypothetical protein